jgi:hypothetical protein
MNHPTLKIAKCLNDRIPGLDAEYNLHKNHLYLVLDYNNVIDNYTPIINTYNTLDNRGETYLIVWCSDFEIVAAVG